MTILKKRRLALGLSQMDLAEKVGVSLLTIQLWERGVSEPNDKNKKILESVLKTLEKKKEGK
jgi:ribosome-binding protein aMBF1 (putative translation factor)